MALSLFLSVLCYNIPISESPLREKNPETRVERWCYQKTDHTDYAVYAFNADGDRVKPELSFLVDRQDIVTHGSLQRDQVTVHRVRAQDFNPFSVPLSAPENLQPLVDKSFLSADFVRSSDEVLKKFLDHKNAPVMNFSIHSDNEIHTTAIASYFPWRGYWWPVNNRPMHNPLGRYDAYVAGQTGTNPNTVGWESANHRYNGVKWEGHCNGWAASSVLRNEPSTPRTDPTTGTVFRVSDQKGLLAELDYCASAAFFGKRYRGTGGDIQDIYPAAFHKTLLYYVGQLSKPVAMDYVRTGAVDNHVISGYAMNVQQTAPNTYNVVTTLNVHGYDKSLNQMTGTAPIYTRTYRYVLQTDSNGNPSGGYWLSGNPDFMWVPLSPIRCKSNNQRLDASHVSAILQLPASR